MRVSKVSLDLRERQDPLGDTDNGIFWNLYSVTLGRFVVNPVYMVCESIYQRSWSVLNTSPSREESRIVEDLTKSFVIDPEVMKAFHADTKLQGDSLKKQVTRDFNGMQCYLNDLQYSTINGLEESILEAIPKSVESFQSVEAKNVLAQRILRLCQQAIFQPGFDLVHRRLLESHFVMQNSQESLCVHVRTVEDTISAEGVCGLKLFKKENSDDIDLENPEFYRMKFFLDDVVKNTMRCTLEKVSVEVKKKNQ